jgi:hypothetical protein
VKRKAVHVGSKKSLTTNICRYVGRLYERCSLGAKDRRYGCVIDIATHCDRDLEVGSDDGRDDAYLSSRGIIQAKVN